MKIKKLAVFILLFSVFISSALYVNAAPIIKEKNLLYATRGRAIKEVASIIDNFISTKNIDNNKDIFFNDMTDSQSKKVIGTAENIGLIFGSGNGKLNPDDDITRQDYALLLKRTFELLDKYGKSFKLPEMSESPFDNDSSYGSQHNIRFEDVKDARRDSIYALDFCIRTGLLTPKYKTVNVTNDTAMVKYYLMPDGKVTMDELSELKEKIQKMPLIRETINNFR